MSVGLGTSHELHCEDVLSIDLADGNGNAHIALVENSLSLDGSEGRRKKELSSNRVVGGTSAALNLASNILPELITSDTARGSGSTETARCAARVHQDTTLSDADGHGTGWWDAHSLHHLLETDSVDCEFVSLMHVLGFYKTYQASG